MKIRELLILARIDPKTQKKHAAAKNVVAGKKLPYVAVQGLILQGWACGHAVGPGGQGRGEQH